MTQAAPPPPPPGWYEDPNDSMILRWWDGASWGPPQPEHTDDLGNTESNSVYTELPTSKQPSATSGFVLSIAGVLFLAEPDWSLLLGLISLFLAFLVFKNKDSSRRNLFISKITLGISAVVIFGSLVLLAGSSEAGDSSANTDSDVASSASEDPFVPAEFREVNERDYALIAKDPTNHLGEKIVIYGVVTQFDSNTGACSFRANTSAIPHISEYEYNENTFISGKNTAACNYLENNVVSNDQFKAWVQVDGVLDYKTQIGGTSTALDVNALHLEVTNETN